MRTPLLQFGAALSLMGFASACWSQQVVDYKASIAHQVTRVDAEIAPSHHSAPFHPDWNSLAGYRTPAWFQDAKFGIFLHWGVYSVPAFGNEWYSRNMYIPKNDAYKHQVATYGPITKFGYKDFVPLFRAEHFDANQWIELFQEAGARYVVPVAEHCDGFAMYASDMTPWNVLNMGPHQDTTGELARAARAHGLRFGVSSHTAEHWWWYGVGKAIPSDVKEPTAESALLYGPAAPMALPTANGSDDLSKEPDPSHLEQWLPPNKPFLDAWLARSTELVDKYHPDFVYFDWWIGQPTFKPYLQRFASYYYDRSAEWNAQPVLTYKEESMPANVATLDIERGKLDTLRLLPWQTDTSVSIHSWGYVEHDEYRTAPSLIEQLLDTVSKNGNLLLNVGPKADGTIPEEAAGILRQMGSWLRMNGAAIYGSRPFTVFGEGPTKADKNSTQMHHDIQTYTSDDVRYTTNDDPSHKGSRLLYASLMQRPASGSSTLHVLFRGNPYLDADVCSVHSLAGEGALPFIQDEGGLKVTLPSAVSGDSLSGFPVVLAIRTDCRGK